MATYILKVTRIVPHPEAGKAMPSISYHWNEPQRVYPDTTEDGMLSVEVSEDDWAAIKAAVLERYK